MRLLNVFALAALLLSAGVSAQQVYKWKDADGVTHYTATPPPQGQSGEKLAVNAGTGLSADATDTADADQVDTTGAAAAPDGLKPDAAKQRSAACTRARGDLTLVESNPFVTMDKDGDGTQEMLSVEEHDQQIARLRNLVKSLCPQTQAAAP